MIDTVDFFRKQIENPFVNLMFYEEMVDRVQFAGFSQIWQEPPAWYLWMKQVKGAFNLQLADVRELQQPAVGIHGTYLIKHFPSLKEEEKQQLSPQERDLFNEDFFDVETSTPKFEHVGDLEETDFLIGILDVVGDIEENFVSLHVSAVDRGAETHHRGWHDSFILFQLLVKVSTFFHRLAPQTVLYHDEQNHLEQQQNVRSCSVFYQLRPEYNPDVKAILQALELDDSWGLTLTAATPSPASVDWWSLATATCDSHLSGTCGCSHD
jgi:hypothetical protein